jgi:hypothetical protein
MAATTTVVLAIVTKTEDVSLACTTSLLRLQQQAARREDIVLDVHIVPELNDALNLVSGDYVIAIDAQCGFTPEFVFGVVESEHSAVAGVYPLPKVDWARVKKVLHSDSSKEPLNHAGNVYNLTPAVSTMRRYVPVTKVEELRVLALKSSLIKDLMGPSTSYAGNTKHLLCHDSVYDDAFHNCYQTFFRKISQLLVADVEAPCMMSAPAQFAGCVGMRASVR